jgi:asparagine synthase (glutamine-hydrolysing)
MCGIAGFLTAGRSQPAEESSVRAMIAALKHRGPDDVGSWVDYAAGVALGHRRLSVIDLSALAHQPMHSKCGRYTKVFNGEIYNFMDLRRELMAKGRQFVSNSDTEVLLEALAAWGVGSSG